MATCNDCVYYEICSDVGIARCDIFDDKMQYTTCLSFKDKSRYIELPCAVGDTVYVIYDDEVGEYVITEFCIGTLQELRVFAKCGISGYKNIQDCPEYYCGQLFCSTSFLCQDFGKTVFFTREEAEKALKLKEREQ